MSKTVYVKDVPIGGGNRIAVQSMTTVKTSDVSATVEQIKRLQAAGCDIVRFSVLNEADARAVKEIKKQVSLPLVADIHFDYRLALAAIEAGVDKVRINPGNIGSDENVKKVADAIKSNGVAVRVGSNTGSIEKEFLNKYGRTEQALSESALKHVRTLEKQGVDKIVISVKASDVSLMTRAYTLLSSLTDYPLHLGVTEAGGAYDGIVKNSVGIGSLLLKGIGDTIRVSLSDDPVEEVKAGHAILRAVGLEKDFVEVVACPTCGRCEWDCMDFAARVTDYVKPFRKRLKVAVMGCVVNGPGEAADADLGIAGGKENAVLFKAGKILKTLKVEDAKEEFMKELNACLKEI